MAGTVKELKLLFPNAQLRLTSGVTAVLVSKSTLNANQNLEQLLLVQLAAHTDFPMPEGTE